MAKQTNSGSPAAGADAALEALDYWVDAVQRSILFMDALRQRGNLYLEHLEAGKPPVLTFAHETVLDGRNLPRPVNYALARIIPTDGTTADPDKRPIVIIDPRAGHGPGIGGSKRDSEVGVALHNGHPVYFVFFYPQPMPGQTLADVKKAEETFVETVAARHPGADEPAVIGNCQAGWAVALLGAERPDITGPLVLNGAPLSYWAGLRGRNPMRYRGGIFGGTWITSLMNDLGNGKFDGANLVANFEDLNPANTYWTKQYNLWAKVDTEARRYLNFEKWWNGYFFMTAEEIHWIVDNLFVGNKLQEGKLELSKGRTIDLKNLEDPVVVFTSSGDNITPPQQALNWIIEAYRSVDEIRRQGQVIVYRVHEDIGHLGIFVSGKVAKKEHREIIGTIDLVEYLSPGLYEMVIEEKGKTAGVTDYHVRFEERTIDDLRAFDDGTDDEAAFRPAAAVSEINDALYHLFLSPWVRMAVNETTAETLRQLHPLRVSRYAFSDRNPFMAPVRAMAEAVRENRQPVSPENRWRRFQEAFSAGMAGLFDLYRDQRDLAMETAFYALYDNPVVRSLFPEPEEEASKRRPAGRTAPAEPVDSRPAPKAKPKKAAGTARDKDRARWLAAMKEGGLAEGIVRVMVAMAGADRILDKAELESYEKILKSHDGMKGIRRTEFKKMVKDQARILQTDQEKAIASLPKLLSTTEQRLEVVNVAKRIAFADTEFAGQERALLKKIQKALDL